MIILLGKTASGKDTIQRYLVNNYGYKKLVTYTTRPMRPGEIQNVTYHYISEDEFIEKIQQGFFLEYKVYNTEFGDWYYGSAKEDYKNADDKTIIILTPQGYLDLLCKIKNIKHDAIYIKCSIAEIQKRLTNRGDYTKEAERRMLSDISDFQFVEDIADRVIENENKTLEEICGEIIERI